MILSKGLIWNLTNISRIARTDTITKRKARQSKINKNILVTV